MNEDLTRELKFAQFLEGVGTRSSMGEALVAVESKDPTRATMLALTEGIGGECVALQ